MTGVEWTNRRAERRAPASDRRPPPAEPTVRPVRSAGQWTRFLLGWAVLVAVLLGISQVDATGRFGVAILAVVLVAGIGVERVLYGTRTRKAFRLLGFGRPGGRALLAAGAVGALVQLVYPLTSMLTGVTLTLRRAGRGC